jgi:hypothetical protein
VNGHKENWPIRSKGFKRWLTRGFYESAQSVMACNADVDFVLRCIELRSQCHGVPDGKERRIAHGGETIWLHAECQRFFFKEQGIR